MSRYSKILKFAKLLANASDLISLPMCQGWDYNDGKIELHFDCEKNAVGKKHGDTYQCDECFDAQSKGLVPESLMMTSTNFGDKSFYKDNISRHQMSYTSNDDFDINNFKEVFDSFFKEYENSLKYSSKIYTPGYIALQSSWNLFDIDLITFKENDEWRIELFCSIYPEGNYESKIKFYSSQIKSFMLNNFILVKENLSDNQYSAVFKI